MPVPRIADEVARLDAQGERWIAFEYFPPKTESGVANLKDRMQRMKRHAPLYIDVTWGAGGTSSDTTMDLCVDAQKMGLVANMHLTCTNMPREKLDNALVSAHEHGLVNILALRGDPPVGQVDFKPVETGFACALDLIRHLRAKTGNRFSITCAGYPEGHPDRIKPASELGRPMSATEEARSSVDVETGVVYVCSDKHFNEELLYLKAKVDAGAQMVVTQLFYDTQVYVTFVDACRAVGIVVPIVPGLMCITSAPGFFKMLKFCKTRAPPKLLAEMTALKDAEADKVKAFGVAFGLDMCNALLASKRTTGLHFCTMNVDAVVDGILQGLHWQSAAAAASNASASTTIANPWWMPGQVPWWS